MQLGVDTLLCLAIRVSCGCGQCRVHTMTCLSNWMCEAGKVCDLRMDTVTFQNGMFLLQVHVDT